MSDGDRSAKADWHGEAARWIERSLSDDYAVLSSGAAVVDFAPRGLIEVHGPDAAEFVHNFCTNDVRRLADGQGCEAYFLDAKGHVFAPANLYRGPDSVVIEVQGSLAGPLLKHLTKYHIRERLVLRDRTAERGELLLAGPQAAAVLERMGVAAPDRAAMAHRPATIGGREVVVRRVDITAASDLLIEAAREDLGAVREALCSGGATPAGCAAVEVARIERGTPWFGVDVTNKNLPQELARDARTISFTKGCYLGQETVARLDALGHVNRLLARLVWEGEPAPAPGAVLRDGETEVGSITSAAMAPGEGRGVALGWVKRGRHAAGTTLTVDGRMVTVRGEA